MVRVLYNLTYYQVVAQLLSGMTAKQREAIRTSYVSKTDKNSGILHAARLLLDTLNDSEIFADDEAYEEASTSMAPDLNNTLDFAGLEKEVYFFLLFILVFLFYIHNLMYSYYWLQLQKLCLPFLRISALLRHHLYGEDLPEVLTPEAEFLHLICYLDLFPSGNCDFSACLNLKYYFFMLLCI